MHVVLQEARAKPRKKTDRVTVHYTGWLLDGTKFDSSVDKNQPITVSLQRGVIPGWLEGLALMKVGEKRKFIIPPNLGYGANPRPAAPSPECVPGLRHRAAEHHPAAASSGPK